MSVIGVSDLIGVYCGAFVAIEVKRPETINNLSRLQKWFISKINECGGIAFSACSLDEAQKKLAEMYGNKL